MYSVPILVKIISFFCRQWNTWLPLIWLLVWHCWCWYCSLVSFQSEDQKTYEWGLEIINYLNYAYGTWLYDKVLFNSTWNVYYSLHHIEKRGHANFIEIVPMAIMLLFFAEQILSRIYVLMLAALLLFGRCLHAYAFAYIHDGKNGIQWHTCYFCLYSFWHIHAIGDTHLSFRVTGTVCTITQILACTLTIIGNSIMHGWMNEWMNESNTVS